MGWHLHTWRSVMLSICNAYDGILNWKVEESWEAEIGILVIVPLIYWYGRSTNGFVPILSTTF